MFSLRKPGAPLAALLVAGLLVAPGVALGGKVYIWTDEKGVKHISDQPPAQAPADMKSLKATPGPGRPDLPDSSGATDAPAPRVVDGVMVGPDGQPVLGPDGQPVHIGPDGQPVQPGQPGIGPDGQMLPAVQSAPDPKQEEREALQRRLQELQKEKEAYDLANRRARSAGDGYAKQRSRYYQNDVTNRINEVESRLRLLDGEGEPSGGASGDASGDDGGQ
ncbi:DUF4124 domain-containing protein [Nitratidesulfovibrio sp. 1201_IL3209]|uniref:DUF4124 domain-containing protein n=1 Tax=Nitratidesulfovibrio sp. 1201_IL3209 TaxID=3084053 RepID=UPI002FDB22E0